MPQQITGNFYFPSDLGGKAGAIHTTPNGSDWYIPVGGSITSGNAIGNVINQMTGNSIITQTSAIVTGNAVSGSQADLFVAGYGLTTLQPISTGTSGNPTATLSFYGSADGQNFSQIPALSKSDGTIGSTNTNLNTIYSLDTRGLQYVRTLVSNYSIPSGSTGSISMTGMSEGYAGSSHYTVLAGTEVMQPVDIQGIYYKTPGGLDAIPIYAPDSLTYGTGKTTSDNLFPVADFPMLSNTTSFNSFDSMTNNMNVTIQTSTAKTATFSTSDQTNYNAKGVIIFVNVTANSGTTPTLQPIIQIKDGASSVYFPVLTASANITGNGMYVYAVYPTAIAGVTQSVNLPLPRLWNIQFVIGGTTPSFTFTVGASYIL